MPVIVSPPGNSTYSQPNTARFVEYKTAWSDQWQLLPYAQPLFTQEDVIPNISSAQLTRWLGDVYESGMSSFQTFLPVDLRDRYVRFRTQVAGSNPVTQWVGIATETTFDVDGVSAGRAQNVQCYGLAYLLNRVPINRSWTMETVNDVVTEVQVDHLPTFNKRSHKGRTLDGNRSEHKSETYGCFMFSSDGFTWSNLDIVEYYLKTGIPRPATPPMAAPVIPFSLAGAAAQTAGSADLMTDVYNQSGTAWSMICRMLDRKYGLTARIDVSDPEPPTVFDVPSNGPNGAKLFIDTITKSAITFGTKTLQANSNPVNFTFPSGGIGAHLVDPVDLRFTTQTRWDKIVVWSQRLISMFNISFLNSTLERGWDVTNTSGHVRYDYDQRGQIDGQKADVERAKYRFQDVFQRYVIPKNWNWKVGDNLVDGAPANFFVLPKPLKDGTFDTTTSGDTWQFDKVLDRILPLMKGIKYDEANAADTPADHTDNPDGTEEEFRPMFLMAYDTFVGRNHVKDDLLHRLDTMNTEGPGLHNLTPTPLDKQMGFRVQCSPNHYVAGGDFAETEVVPVIRSMSSPELNYRQLVATVAVTTDVRARIEKQMTQPTENSKTLYIEVPGAEFWYCTPKTIIDVNGGVPVRIHLSNVWLRKDKAKLEVALAFASAHFGEERQSVSIPIKVLGFFVPLCSYLTAISSLYTPYTIGTVVTSRRHDYANNTTTIVTGWGDNDQMIEPVMFDPKSPLKKRGK